MQNAIDKYLLLCYYIYTKRVAKRNKMITGGKNMVNTKKLKGKYLFKYSQKGCNTLFITGIFNEAGVKGAGNL